MTRCGLREQDDWSVSGYPREPAFASEITTDVADLTAVVEVVKQDDGEPRPHFSGHRHRQCEVPVEVRRGEGIQAGQRLLPHCFGIPL